MIEMLMTTVCSVRMSGKLVRGTFTFTDSEIDCNHVLVNSLPGECLTFKQLDVCSLKPVKMTGSNLSTAFMC